MRQLAIISLLLLFIFPVQGQDGRGLVREAIADNLAQISSFNPLRCGDATCFWAVQHLFPTLLAYSPETRWFGEATAENHALALSWELSEDNRAYRFQLREDARWSDGSPITAYDYFYSYLAIKSQIFSSPYYDRLNRSVEAVIPINTTELLILFKENDCDALVNVNFPIAPAHVFEPNFAEEAAAFFTEGDALAQWQAWQEEVETDFSRLLNHPFDRLPSVTAGEFDFVRWQPYEYIRLQNGELALELVPVLNADEEVNRFLNGELTILTHPPRNRWADISAALDVQTIQMPSSRWDFIAFNFEEAYEPNSAFDEDGNPLEQEPNPFFTDLRVRQAIQHAINVPELIERGLQGQASLVPAFFTARDWAYDASLSPYSYNPELARDLLNEAGWLGNRGARTCIDCGTAENYTRFAVSLGYGNYPHQEEVATLIARQLLEVGIAVSIFPSDVGSITYQTFDIYLGTWGDRYPITGMDELFLPEQDIIARGLNLGSYNNPELSELIIEGKTASGCVLDERIASYQAAQRILYDDLPYAWLYVQDERYAVRGSVQNVQPVLGLPFANLSNWLVFDARVEQ